jgi:CRP-like cAMP-binding protein
MKVWLTVYGVSRGKKTKDLALALGTPYIHVNRALGELCSDHMLNMSHLV